MRTFGFLSALIAAQLLAGTAVAADKQRIEERRRLNANGTLTVENVSGSVKIIGTDEETMSMVGLLGADVEKVEVSGEGDHVRIKTFVERGNDGGVDFEIRAPRSARFEIRVVSADVDLKNATGTAEVNSVSGEINIGGELRSIELKSVSGDIDIQAASERLDAESVSGDIKAAYASGEVELETVSGDMIIAGGTITRFRAKSVSGNVELHGDIKGSGSSKIESHSGDVRLELGSGTDAKFEVSTFSGRIKAELSGAEVGGKSSHFRIGSGTASVDIRTFSGDVRVRNK